MNKQAKTRNGRSNGRNKKGSALIDIGPALIILFLFFFFPLINLISLPVMYYSINTLNNLQVREASLEPKSQAQDPSGVVMQEIPNNWKNSGLGKFVTNGSDATTTVTYKDCLTNPKATNDKIVSVQTDITIRPFIACPFFPGVPGLGSPIAYTVHTERPLENPNYFNE